MKKIYNTPSTEITNVQLLQMISASVDKAAEGETGDHIADAKAINFAESDGDMWGTEE